MGKGSLAAAAQFCTASASVSVNTCCPAQGVLELGYRTDKLPVILRPVRKFVNETGDGRAILENDVPRMLEITLLVIDLQTSVFAQRGLFTTCFP
jgi:hypothetical protein